MFKSLTPTFTILSVRVKQFVAFSLGSNLSGACVSLYMCVAVCVAVYVAVCAAVESPEI